MAPVASPLLILSFLCTLAVNPVVLGGLVLEDGYTVTTILDANKLDVNPFSIIPQFRSSDLIVLDNLHSSFFTLSFVSPKESVIRKLAGSGGAGYMDGELGSAMFDKPTNFAVDFRGNIYVADVHNHVIRKISKSGVTTIAGGYSQMIGKTDGLAQNATFSNNFELTFVPDRCALIISDRANKLIRQINLKTEDCAHGSHSDLGMSSVWALGIGISCLLLGLIVGFVSRPYVISRKGMRLLPCKGTWRHCLMSLVRQVPTLCFDIRSAVVSLPLYMLLERLILLSLSNLSLMLRTMTVEFRTSCKKPSVEVSTFCKKPSLLDFDDSKSRIRPKFDQLEDLISFNEGVESLSTSFDIEPKDGTQENTNVSIAGSCNSKIDKMVQANIMGFSEQARITSALQSLECNVLVKRKPN